MVSTAHLDSMERAGELRDLILSLAALRDPEGVLSVTVGIAPGAVSGGTPAWEIALENDLTAVQRGPRATRDLERRLAELAPRIADLVDPVSFGRGRALFVAIESGLTTDVALQAPLPTGARVGPAAHVLPLLASLEAGTPAGLLSASRDEVVVLEAELGMVHEVGRVELEPTIFEWPEMKGAVRANPVRGAHTVSQRDRHERRLAAAYRHTLDEAVGTIGSLAEERGWTRAVLAGDPRLTLPLDEVLAARRLPTATVHANLEGLRPDDAVRRLEAALDALVADHALALVRRASEEAAAGGLGACGLAPVLAALAEGRVERLLVDPGRPYTGTVGEEERLRPREEGEEPVELTDLIVSHALSTGAAVTPVLAGAAETLAGCGGIGALLRW
jgi:hypothetical protein